MVEPIQGEAGVFVPDDGYYVDMMGNLMNFYVFFHSDKVEPSAFVSVSHRVWGSRVKSSPFRMVFYICCHIA